MLIQKSLGNPTLGFLRAQINSPPIQIFKYSSFSFNVVNYRMEEWERGPDTFDSYRGLYAGLQVQTFDSVFFVLLCVSVPSNFR